MRLSVMKPITSTFLAALAILGASVTVRAEKAHVIFITDMAEDDGATLVRGLLHSDMFDLRGVVGTTSDPGWPTSISQILKIANAYKDNWANISANCPNCVHPDTLLKQSVDGAPGTTAGRDLLCREVKRAYDNDYDLWITSWGTAKSPWLSAMNHIRQGNVPGLNIYQARSKIFYAGEKWSHVQNDKFAYRMLLDTFYPSMDGGRWYHRWVGLTNPGNILDRNRDIVTNHGSLCALYTEMKEGDTPAIIHLFENGLNVPNFPQWGSWAGRATWNYDNSKIWSISGQDRLGGSSPNRDNSVLRWGTAISTEFKARADYSVSRSGNLPPSAVIVNDKGGWEPVFVTVPAGQSVAIVASALDPNPGSSFTWKWEQYREISSTDISISNSSSSSPTLVVPSGWLAKDTAHIIATVTDNGTIPLTRYRRVVLVHGSALCYPPGVPQGFSATAASASTVNLEWKGVGGVSSYKVYREGEMVAQVNGTRYTSAGLSPNKYYRFEVSAVGLCEGGKSRPMSATTQGSGGTTRLEGELAYYSNGSNQGNPVGSDASCSGGGKIGVHLNGDIGWVYGTPTAGRFDLRFRISSDGDDYSVVVNSTPVGTLTKSSSGWAEKTISNVSLNAGNNWIILYDGTQGYNPTIDYVDVIQATTTESQSGHGRVRGASPDGMHFVPGGISGTHRVKVNLSEQYALDVLDASGRLVDRHSGQSPQEFAISDRCGAGIRLIKLRTATREYPTQSTFTGLGK